MFTWKQSSDCLLFLVCFCFFKTDANYVYIYILPGTVFLAIQLKIAAAVLLYAGLELMFSNRTSPLGNRSQLPLAKVRPFDKFVT